MKNVVLYQVKKDKIHEFGFLNYNSNIKYNGSINIDNYEKTYECERDDDYTENSAFDEFNINHPEDFKGYSMSTGDIVVIDGKALYCDSFGWKVVTEILGGK